MYGDEAEYSNGLRPETIPATELVLTAIGKMFWVQLLDVHTSQILCLVAARECAVVVHKQREELREKRWGMIEGAVGGSRRLSYPLFLV